MPGPSTGVAGLPGGPLGGSLGRPLGGPLGGCSGATILPVTLGTYREFAAMLLMFLGWAVG